MVSQPDKNIGQAGPNQDGVVKSGLNLLKKKQNWSVGLPKTLVLINLMGLDLLEDGFSLI